MAERNGFIVSVFLIFILAIPAMIFAQRVIDLDKVWGDVRVLGRNITDECGRAVAQGDINGDGYMDLIIGASFADPGDPPLTDAGVAYVIFGSSSPASTLDLSIDSADITVCGYDKYSYTGNALASGDVNGDGFDDLIIGAPCADTGTPSRFSAGETYIIFGSSSLPSTIDLSVTQADITICGAVTLDNFGCAVDSGDVNGDEYDDMIIGAYNADPGTPERYAAGETYVFFGNIFSTPTTIDLSVTPADITICGADANDNSGWAVASGDVNSDGYDDLIIGAYLADPGTPARLDAGEAYVIFGSSLPSSSIDLSTQSADITVCGVYEFDSCGNAVASGDVNGDGYDDIIVCAYWADPSDRMEAGETYVIFGKSFASPTTIDLNIESADITICGDYYGDWSGWAVASGDVNGDGNHDLIIGARLANPSGITNAGETYVIFGKSFLSPPYTIELNSQPADITVCGDNDRDESGWAVASGDVNGDGCDDIIIGAHYADPGGRTNAGETYLISGGGSIITAHGLGGKSWIKEFSLLGRDWGSFKAFGVVNSEGEVHLAVGDTDADSLDEIVAGQGEGAKSWVKIFEVDGSPISTFKAFGAANTYGEVHLTLGNFDEDLNDTEIAVAQGEGGQSWVKTFETDGTLILSFKTFGAANAQGEVHLSSGDLNKDGIDEIIAGMGEGGSSRVKVFNLWGDFIRSFRAFDSIDNPGGEVRLAVGNFNADDDVEIAVATGYNGGNRVKLFDKLGNFIREFTPFGFGGNPNGDVQITAADIDNDGIDEIICGHGEGGSSVVKVFKADGTAIFNFKAFGFTNSQGEVHLGKSNY